MIREALALIGTLSLFLAIPAIEAAVTPAANLVQACGTATYTTVPTSCGGGWTWQAPVKGSMVVTSGGSWRLFQVPPTADVLVLCAAPLVPGAALTACPAASVVKLPGCNAVGQTCAPPVVVTPPAVYADGTATVTWTNPTTNTDGSTLTTLASVEIWRGTKADGSDLAKYSSFGAAQAATYTDTKLTVGNWCYALYAVRTDGARSVQSNVGCKAIVAPPIATQPNPITNVKVVLLSLLTPRYFS